MRTLFLSCLSYTILSALLISPPLYAKEPIPVVVTLPILKDLVEKVGAKHLTVTSLITGLESEHTYTPKPSDILAVKKARLLVKIGLGLESWVDPLIRNADRNDLYIVTTSDNVPIIHQDDADHHATGARGNPHIWLDPENVKIMTRHITNGLSRIDPSHQDAYRKNETVFIEKLDGLTNAMIKRMETLPNRKIITHHPAWPYFAKRFGLIIQGEIQSHVGGEPSPKRIGTLIQLIRREKVGAVVSEPQLDSRIPQILKEETGVPVVILSPLPGALPNTASYFDFIRYNAETLANALQGP